MNRKEWIELGAIVAGAAAVYLVMTRGNMEVAPSEVSTGLTGGVSQGATPQYLGYNQNNPLSTPLSNVSPQTAGSAPTGNNASAPTGCGTGSGVTMYASNGALETSLNSALGAIVSQYQTNVEDQFPDYVAQFFNNVTGEDEATAATTTFANYGSA